MTDTTEKPSALSARARRALRARFDAAQTTPENARHWAAADAFSPNAAVSPWVRQVLRQRARYEIANNSYAKGITQTLTNDTVGCGPRLQMLTESADANAVIEREFAAWARAVGLADKLRQVRQARTESGEVFGIAVNNPRLATPVQLDVRLIEADQIADPTMSVWSPTAAATDGIDYDAAGNPTAYRVLKFHPGDPLGGYDPAAFDLVPADQVVHYFRADRPGQRRGIPEITPALPLFAMLRRFTLAVLAAAETAADFAAVLYTDAPADGSAADVDPMDVIELERRMATTLPAGWSCSWRGDPVRPGATATPSAPTCAGTCCARSTSGSRSPPRRCGRPRARTSTGSVASGKCRAPPRAPSTPCASRWASKAC